MSGLVYSVYSMNIEIPHRKMCILSVYHIDVWNTTILDYSVCVCVIETDRGFNLILIRSTMLWVRSDHGSC